MFHFKTALAATTLAAFTLTAPAMAGVVNTTANVVFIVDESGSMGGDQAFLKNSVVDQLDAGLAAAGVTNRSYGVVGYGASNPAPHVLGTGLQNPLDTKASLENLVTSGGFEDGWRAIDFALNAFAYSSNAAINFILVTDEDRDVTFGSTLTFNSVLASLTSRNILLNAIVDNRFSNGSTRALGIDDQGDAYLADGSGGFTTSTGGVAGSGSGTTKADYVDLALGSGGAAWDIGLLRSGGNDTSSFASAFIDIKVQEITTQPPSTPAIPLPAAGWLMITGLGGLAALRRRRKSA